MSNEQLAISNDPQTRQMKDSGVECIGEIPESWEIRRNKELFYEVNDRCSADTELPLLSVSEYHGVTPKVENSGILTRAESLEGYKICKENDIVMNIMLAWKRAQAVSKYQGIVSPAYCVYRNKSNGLMNMDYVHYLIRSDLYIGIFKMYSTGIIDSRLRLYPDKFLSLYSHVPPADVQQTIAAYLDRKCTQIDTLIANQQQQIEKLKAYKQSVITETVTKGLDPDVTMKDSGVEWIGRISTKHSIKKLKFLLSGSLMYGANESGEPYDESLPRYIRITDIAIDGSLKTTGRLSLSDDIATPYLLKDGDILFARSGATVGKAFIFKSEYGKSAFAGYLIKARVKDDVDPQYIYYYTQSSLYEEWKNQIFIQATIQNIGADKYSQLPVVIQSLEEQHEIVAYLDCKCSQIDRLIAIKQQKIEKLQQYKKSLIYEYVTGKKEVI